MGIIIRFFFNNKLRQEIPEEFKELAKDFSREMAL